MEVFWQSVAGRVLLTAMGIANASAATYALSGNVHALGIGLPIAIALGIVAIGLAVASHPTHALFGVILLPFLLFLLALGSGVALSDPRPSWGWGFLVIAVLAIVGAVRPKRLPAIASTPRGTTARSVT